MRTLYLRNVPANIQRLFSISGVEDAVPPEVVSRIAGSEGFLAGRSVALGE